MNRSRDSRLRLTLATLAIAALALGASDKGGADKQKSLAERMYADRADPNTIINEITTIDNALTRPWTATKKYRRVSTEQPVWPESACAEGNVHVEIAGQNYFLSAEGLLMPARRDQPPPDLKYFEQSKK